MQDYLKGIVYITLISAIISQLLPREDYRKYGRILSGFLILLLFLQPFLQWSDIYPQFEQKYEQLLEDGKGKLEGSNEKYQEKQKKVIIEEAVANVMLQSGYETKEVEVSVRGEEIRRISVRLKGTIKQEEKDVLSQYLGEQYSLKQEQIYLE